jgi:hypothetical protein
LNPGRRKAVNKAAEGNDRAEVRTCSTRRRPSTPSRRSRLADLEVTKENDRIVVIFAYQREIHLAGPAYLTLKYSGRSK